MSETTVWEPCPNIPACPHTKLLHELEDFPGSRLICSINDCECGREEG